MVNVFANREWPWAGLVGGAALWYAAHDIGFYFSGHECKYSWVLPVVHVLAFIGTVYCWRLSYRSWSNADYGVSENRGFISGVSVAAASLFALVIVWQGLATIIYRGCEK